MLKVHMPLVSRNAGNEKNRHLGVCKFIYFFYQLNLLNKVYTSGTTLTAGVGLVKQGAGFVIYLFIFFCTAAVYGDASFIVRTEKKHQFVQINLFVENRPNKKF